MRRMKKVAWAAVVWAAALGAAAAGTKFSAEELPPDAGAIAGFSCIARDEHQVQAVVTAPEKSYSEVRWVAEATATYPAGHVPGEWKRVIGMTAWERETERTKTQIGKMGSYCVEWAEQVQARRMRAAGRK